MLIEKEWITFGHRFSDRCGFSNNNVDKNEVAPIFLQWCECVYQLLSQFPAAFEFDERLLIYILDNAYAGLTASFIFNCEAELLAAYAKSKTPSLWTPVVRSLRRLTRARSGSGTGGGTLSGTNSKRGSVSLDQALSPLLSPSNVTIPYASELQQQRPGYLDFLNPGYCPVPLSSASSAIPAGSVPIILRPNLSTIRFWSGYYFRFVKLSPMVSPSLLAALSQ